MVIRALFDLDDIANGLERVEQRLLERVRDDALDDDLLSSAESDLDSFRQVADLLTTPTLGTA